MQHAACCMPQMHTKLENLALKAVAKQLSEAVILTDPDGKVTWVNKACEKLCGYHLSELRGKKPGEMLQGEDTDQQTINDFRTAVKGGLNLRADILNYHKDGHSYWARVSITPLRGITGALQGFIAIERDITKEHENLEELHGEVVELYATILREVEEQGPELKPDDPFCGQPESID